MQELTVLILTPLALEFRAAARNLSRRQDPAVIESAAYTIGAFEGRHYTYKVVIREPGMTPVQMAIATEKAIKEYKPQIALLMGVAGGIKDVTIGDVLVADKVYGYEGGKDEADGMKARPISAFCSKTLVAYAQIVREKGVWKDRTHDMAFGAKVWIGPIAAGNKVVAGSKSATYHHIKQHYNDTLGVEMEADGFIQALQNHPRVHGLVVRGISDMCDDKNEASDDRQQPLAAERAAAVVFELLNLLENLDVDSNSPGSGGGIQVIGSKNVVIGSNIQGSTISIGDTTVHQNNVNTGANDAEKARIRALIAAGRTEQAISEMLQSSTGERHNEILSYSDRFQTLSRKIRMRLISNDEANIERNQIVAGVLEMLG